MILKTNGPCDCVFSWKSPIDIKTLLVDILAAFFERSVTEIEIEKRSANTKILRATTFVGI